MSEMQDSGMGGTHLGRGGMVSRVIPGTLTVGNIDTQLDGIGSVINDLNDRLDWLFGRIEPVLTPDHDDSTMKVSGDVNTFERSLVANRLDTYHEALGRCVNRINTIGARIEL